MDGILFRSTEQTIEELEASSALRGYQSTSSLSEKSVRLWYTWDMTRKFKTPDYESTLNQTITLRDALPPTHLARFVVDIIAQLDLSKI